MSDRKAAIGGGIVVATVMASLVVAARSLTPAGSVADTPASLSEPLVTTSETATASRLVQQFTSAEEEPSRSNPHRFAVTVNRPAGPPTIELTEVDPLGKPIELACSTCHSLRPPNHDNRVAEQLQDFHQGLAFQHGSLACYACHNPDDYDTLRLADGTSVEYRDVIQLCSQCHAQQAASFARGAHGGMTGFWDLSRGPQQKNNCVDCHHPHGPAIPKMNPTFKPKDRFLKPVTSQSPH